MDTGLLTSGQHLVSTEWLAARLDDPAIRVLECTVFLHPIRGGRGFRREPGRAACEPITSLAAALPRYCDAGIAASSDAFVLALLGHPSVAVYDASLTEWASDPTLPMETGPARASGG